MTTHLEIEYKQMLSKANYLSYLKRFPHAHMSSHINHYFYYSKADIKLAARIREEENHKTLTFKLDQNLGRLEVNFSVNSTELLVFKQPEIQAFLKENGFDGSFEFIGSLHTQRHTIHEDEADLCLDFSTYLGVSDYELEYEVTHNSTRAFQRYLEILSLENLTPIEASPKFARFLTQKRLTK